MGKKEQFKQTEKSLENTMKLIKLFGKQIVHSSTMYNHLSTLLFDKPTSEHIQSKMLRAWEG